MQANSKKKKKYSCSSCFGIVISSGSRIEMGGPRCKIFSHCPMSGPRGAKGLVWYIFSYAKGEKLGPGAVTPEAPLGSATGNI